MAEDFVLITGAAGFIGSNLAAAMAEDGRAVVACDRFGDGDKWKNLAPVLLHDILRPDQLREWLAAQAGQVSTVLHMGAISATTETDVDRILDNNVRLSLDLWDWAAGAGASFIYASSAATYGDGAQGFVDDDSPEALARLRPLNPYGWSKHVVDRRFVDDARRGRPTPPRWAGLKFFNVYGPNEAHKGAMRSVAHQIYPIAARGEAVRLFKSDHPDYPDGGQLRDFVYVRDCVAVVRAMLAAPSLAGIYNVGTGKARSFADLAQAMFKAVGRKPHVDYVAMPHALQGRYQYFTEADTTKLRRDGFAPEFHTLEDGVQDYVRHLASEVG
jgi:ADP-L-glycero-D-manno-heptose 6-epimerase